MAMYIAFIRRKVRIIKLRQVTQGHKSAKRARDTERQYDLQGRQKGVRMSKQPRNVSSQRRKGIMSPDSVRNAEIGSCFIIGNAIGLTVIRGWSISNSYSYIQIIIVQKRQKESQIFFFNLKIFIYFSNHLYIYFFITQRVFLFFQYIFDFMKQRQQEREDSQGKPRKDQKGKLIKKKSQATRDITHYFAKVEKQVNINRNIPTPDKAAIQQIDQAFNALSQQEQELIQQIEEAKIRAQRQKQERQYFFSKSRNLVSTQLKKIAQINRFFKRQDQLKLKEKQHLLNKINDDIRCKKQTLLNESSTPFQEYFSKRQLQKSQKELQRLAMQVAVLKESNRIAQEEESCFFAKEGWPLLMKRYQPLQLVGKGGFSQVYRSYDLYSNQTVAIKLSSVEHLLQGCGNKHEYLKHIKRQYEIHKQLDHPNIVKLIEVIELQSAFCIVLEYCEGFTLAQYLRMEGALPQPQAKMIIEQIAKVIHYLSSQIPSIIHYDLKPQNIIFSKGQLKVLDFGICKTMDSEHSKMALTSQGMGTCCYLPPETLIPNNPVISNKVDVWSLGIIFYELLKGSRPFTQTLSTSSLLNGMTIKQEQFFGLMKIGACCKAFILSCLQVSESKRLNPLAILSHPYMLNSEQS